MIVQPDFLDHWKTQMLVDLSEDEASPLMVLRLWGHCQQRKSSRFVDLTPSALRAICRSKIPATELHGLMIECGFIHLKGRITTVHDWDCVNASLIKNWVNGQKNANRYPKQTQSIPTGGAIDKIREDKIDKKKSSANGSRATPEESEAEWKNGLLRDIGYKHINVPAEFSKWQRWCARNKKKQTRARFEAWLNRIEPPMGNTPTERIKTERKPIPRPPELTDEQIKKNKAVIAETTGKLREKFKMGATL